MPKRGLPDGSVGKESACNAFDSWVETIPWRRAWQPAPVFLPGDSSWTEEPGAAVPGLTKSQTRQSTHTYVQRIVKINSSEYLNNDQYIVYQE